MNKMANQSSMLDITSLSTPIKTNPHEIALQSLCKQLLKSRLFRGYYIERRYVEHINAYRDVVSLQRSEKSLDKMLRDMRDKLQLFYSSQNPNIWIGITNGTLSGMAIQECATLDTHLWVEINDLPFGQYWFSIKSIRFHENEIILKLKLVQEVEEDQISKRIPYSGSNKSVSDEDIIESPAKPAVSLQNDVENQVTLDDFMLLLQQWIASIKQTVYEFMAQDITKKNLKDVLRFLLLFLVTICTSSFDFLKFLGEFVLRFIFEFNRLIHVLTPIILKLMEVFSKVIGGFYILLTMIWKDLVPNRNQPKIHNALEFNRMQNNGIQYIAQPRKFVSPQISGTFNNDRNNSSLGITSTPQFVNIPKRRELFSDKEHNFSSGNN